jgi:hypothetical protein
MEDLKKQITELRKEVEALKVRKIYQTDIIPAAIKPRALAVGDQAKGDIFYSDGNNFIRVPIGTTGQTLKVQNGIPTWTT